MINRKKFALTFGYFGAVMHLIWVLVVAGGQGQAWMDFAHKIHFLGNTEMVMPATFAGAIWMIIFGFILPYIIAWIFSTIWNNVHKS